MKHDDNETIEYIDSPINSAVPFINTNDAEEFEYTINAPLSKIPVVYLNNDAVFPVGPRSIDIEGAYNQMVINNYIGEDSLVFFTYRVDKPEELENTDTPSDHNEAASPKDIAVEQLARIGVVARVMHQINPPEGGHHAFIECKGRMMVNRYTRGKNYLHASLSPYPVEKSDKDFEDEMAVESLLERFIYYLKLMHFPQAEMMEKSLRQAQSPILIMSMMEGQMPFAGRIKQMALERPELKQMAMSLLENLEISISLAEMRKEIAEKTHSELSDQQRENFLQSEIRKIQQELGQGADSDIDELEARARQKKWSEDTANHFNRELNKLTRYNISSPDYSIQYGYLDRMLSLPWQEYSDDKFDLATVEKILNRDHFGLDKVKERILEHMAVIKMRNDLHAPILCLVGPPGVGKTSLGRSIADAMGREYQRISFGGMHDEAEIRGHRRTYIGAMPGRIIAALEKCKTSNPVIVLDEVDKIGADFKGDPSSALLEVLDPEQNSTFHDNYLDTDYDLSRVLFIATANTLSTVSAPLLDRMEVISLSGYITAEKVEIAKKHLIPKLLKEHGFEDTEIDFQRPALNYMVDYYTRESGVRRLEKVIAKVLRKIARLKVSGKEYPTVITRKNVGELLGKEEYSPEMYENNDFTGVVTGLAWTSAGGEILFIESSLTPGEGKLQLTGNLGDVMKESASIALTWLKANGAKYGVDAEKLSKTDIHIHVPEGAIPKDGPSAGVTMTTSLASAITGRKVQSHLAMTGEITLRGKVLPVGGIKEKIIAAKRAGITKIILSTENRKDIEEINDIYLKGLTFVYVERIDDVLDAALI